MPARGTGPKMRPATEYPKMETRSQALGDRAMQRDLLPTLRRLLSGIGAMLLGAAYLPAVQAADPRLHYAGSYYYPYGGQAIYDNFRLRREMDRVGDQIQRQQRQLDEQTRLQQEQSRLLRQQQAAQQQVTARQACYYRYDGGLDLCDRLFEAGSRRHGACVETVAEMNPGCAAEIAMPAPRSRD